tara:strand:- start:271 stop:414 length:144 start_codon:yes stop_codon:yes gene_type:complete
VWGGNRAVDKFTGQSFEHRRAWVEDRLLLIGSEFSIYSAATVYGLVP